MINALEVDLLARWGLYSPDKVAVLDYSKNKTSYSYKDLYLKAQHLAFELQKLGVGANDRVAVLSPNRVETVVLFFALQRLNAVLVPLNFRLSSSEIEYILKDCRPKVLFYDPSFEDVSTKITTQLNSDQRSKDPLECLSFERLGANILAAESSNFKSSELYTKYDGNFQSATMILYTSGTTGFPKGAILTNEMMFWNAMNTSLSLNVNQDDVTINFAPLFHTGGWNVLMTPFFFRGAKVIFLEKFNAEQILTISAEEKVTLLFGVPTMLSMMSESELFKSSDLSSIRYMIVGGEPMNLNLIKTWHGKGVPVRQGFGLTEFGPNCFSLSEKDAETKMGSIGRPNFYVKTRIIDHDGRDVAIGDVGELLLSGPSCMKGYWNNDKATSEAIKDGWFYTGDLVRKDEDHYFYVVGRKKEMFISGGENVYPIEVERILQSHPMVNEAAVVGVKDEKWGEVGHAFLSVKSELCIDEIQEYCRQYLAGFKIPKRFSFMDALPKGDSGKINKKVLKDHKADAQV